MRFRVVLRVAIVLTALLALADPRLSAVQALPGDLDPTFGGTGVVTYHFPGAFQDQANAVAVQTDGKVVVVGTSIAGSGAPRLAVARWDATGVLDGTFGSGGTILLNLTGNDQGMDVLIQPDGNIVVAGFAALTGGLSDFFLARYTSSGVPDPTWGSGGFVNTNFFGQHDTLGGIARQPVDGKIVAVGTVQSVGLGVVRYNTDGSLDTSFGTGGKYTSGLLSDVRRVALQSDGKILAVGIANKACNPCGDFGVVRLNIDGTTDTTFGTGGVAAIDLSGPDRAQALVIQPDDAIVVVGGQGWGFSGTANFGVVRLLSTGAPDPAFGTGGKVIVNAGGGAVFDEAYGVVLEPDGGITATGFAGSQQALVRLTSTGALDPVFGAGGIALHAGGGGPFDIERQADGRLVVAGGGGDLVAARYFNNICANTALEPGEQCDDGNVANGDCCSSACLFESAATVCRVSGGTCDPAELCTGASATCPADVLTPNGTACPDDGEVCTLDVCNGVSTACQHPAGNGGTACRPSSGSCDPGEQCDGANTTCPANGFENAGTPCPSDGEICTADLCDNAGACTHPAGNAGAVCRADAGQCDVAETCNGLVPICPADQFEADGTGCDDGAECTILDQCTAGICGGDSMTCGDGTVQAGCGETCDDANATADDGCDPLCHLEVCHPTPETGCRVPTVSAKSQLKMKNVADNAKDQLQWKWPLGAATTLGDFGNPYDGESYYLCLYDGGALVSTTLVESAVACPTCWKPGATSYAFKNKAHTPDGAEQLKLKSGVNGKAQIQFKGKGANLQMPAGPRTGPVVVQLQPVTPSAPCWEATYGTPFKKNDGTGFVDKAD
ncbi:MAG: hypothetical protein ABIR79_17005 [Candidatus Binatia bacterium]